MDKTSKFFHHISPKVLELTNKKFEKTKTVKYKDKDFSPNLATEVDFDNEKLIKEKLNKWFPNDQIVAEETSPDSTNINKGRKWIIDPICGSYNFKNGIRFFCTNIALSDNGILIASCVVDHSRQEYIWSIGNSQIFINHKLVKPEKRVRGRLIEVDLSALMGVDIKRIKKQTRFISYLLQNKKFYLSSFNTSLPFAYTALGRIDAYANGLNKIWDVAAANFLILQAGGIVSELNGNPWNLSSDNVLASRDKKLHKELLKILND